MQFCCYLVFFRFFVLEEILKNAILNVQQTDKQKGEYEDKIEAPTITLNSGNDLIEESQCQMLSLIIFGNLF